MEPKRRGRPPKPPREVNGIPTDTAMWQPFQEPGAMVYYQQRVHDLFDQYHIEGPLDRPHYQMLIRRIAVVDTRLCLCDMADQTGGKERWGKEYVDQGKLMQAYLDQLMKFNEVANVQNNLRKAQQAQDKLMQAMRQCLCPECVAKVREFIKEGL